MPQYETYQKDVHFKAGETLGFTAGKGYYAKPAPPAAKPPTAAQAAAAGQKRGEATNEYYAAQGYDVGGQNHVYDSTPQPWPPQGQTQGATPPQDWSSYLGIYGLPADVQKELNAIFARTPDVSQAIALATAYVRGTQWYSQTYPGIQEAMAKGTVRNEADYRSQQNGFNQVYRQWTNTDITAGQFADYLKEGVDATTVGKRFQGDAYASTYGADWQYLSGAFGDDGRFSGDDVTTLGRQTADLGSQKGINLQALLTRAQERASRVFQGQLATFAGGIGETVQKQAKVPDVGR